MLQMDLLPGVLQQKPGTGSPNRLDPHFPKHPLKTSVIPKSTETDLSTVATLGEEQRNLRATLANGHEL